MSEKWMVAWDFSPAARAALDLAANEALGTNRCIVLFHAYTFYPVAEPPGSIVGGGRVGVEKTYAYQVAEKVEKVAVEARERYGAIEIETVVTAGAPTDAILEAVEKFDIERIVMGTHGRTGVGHFMLGSVAEKVVRLAPVPVLVVKGVEVVREEETVEEEATSA